MRYGSPAQRPGDRAKVGPHERITAAGYPPQRVSHHTGAWNVLLGTVVVVEVEV